MVFVCADGCVLVSWRARSYIVEDSDSGNADHMRIDNTGRVHADAETIGLL